MRLLSREDITVDNIKYYPVVVDYGLAGLSPRIEKLLKRMAAWLEEKFGAQNRHTWFYMATTIYFVSAEDRTAFILRWTGE